jgi:polyisoprenoid-binding protein YceI
MKKALLFVIPLILFTQTLWAQKWGTRTGQISFFSAAKMEDITATNKKVSAVVDAAAGTVAVSLDMRDFHFRRSLMEEHFNENYVESEKFPKADFRGKIENAETVKWTVDGVYPIAVNGTLTIHGITKPAVVPLTLVIKDGKAGVSGKFPLKLSDYNVKIPTILSAKIAEVVEVNVVIAMAPLGG